MTYATQQSLVDRFGETEIIQLTDTTNAGVINSATLAQTLADTDAQINAYLHAYSLPFDITPPSLVRIACDIARYHLYDVRATELVEARYKDALNFLKNVSNGVASLGVDAAGQPVSEASAGVKSANNGLVFTPETLSGY
jgi:phage gp36-like protein